MINEKKLKKNKVTPLTAGDRVEIGGEMFAVVLPNLVKKKESTMLGRKRYSNCI